MSNVQQFETPRSGLTRNAWLAATILVGAAATAAGSVLAVREGLPIVYDMNYGDEHIGDAVHQQIFEQPRP